MSEVDPTKTEDTELADKSQVDVLLKDEAAMTEELVESADAFIDLKRAGTESEYLMAALTERYEAMVVGYLAGATSNPQMLSKVLRLLTRQIARAQADIFVLKSAVLGRDKLVLTRDWEFRDPLQGVQESLADAFGRTPMLSAGAYAVSLDPSVVGYGWHDVEEKNGHYWRWSGPSLTSGLMLPRFFNVPVQVEVTYNVARRDVLPEDGGISVNGRPVAATIETTDGVNGRIRFAIDLSKEVSPFFMMEFKVLRTVSPAQERGSKDSRELGICVRRIVFETTPTTAA